MDTPICRMSPLNEVTVLTPERYNFLAAGGKVIKVHKLREREFADGYVLNVDVVDEEHGNAKARLFFFDNWAHALSFVGEGDEVVIKGLVVAACPMGGQHYVTTLGQDQSEVVVAQAAEMEDVIELTVNPKDFENPVAKLKHRGPLNALAACPPSPARQRAKAEAETQQKEFLENASVKNGKAMCDDIPGGRTVGE